MSEETELGRAQVLALFQRSREEVDALLAEVSNEFSDPDVREFVRYATGVGRRFRGFLTRVCFHAAGGEGDHVRFAMAAVELLHKASLIHDDIVDADQWRRGRETFHRRFGTREGTIVADLLAALAFGLMERMGGAGSRADLPLCYGYLSAGYRATALGELVDVLMERRQDVTPDQSEAMLRLKSGWLVATACGLGAAAAGAPRQIADALHRYGLDIGTALQVINDINNLTSVDATSKHAVGGDILGHKQSVPLALALAAQGPAADELRALWAQRDPQPAQARRALELVAATGALDASRQRAARLLDGAVTHLDALPTTPFRALLVFFPRSSLTDAYWREVDV